jgi:hypothetical protein
MERHHLAFLAFLATLVASMGVTYALFSPAQMRPIRYAVYGLLWVFVGIAAFAVTRVSPASASTRRRAALVAVGYFAVLAYAGGLVIPAGGGVGDVGFRIAYLPPGWGPALLYQGNVVNLVLMPARVVGYLALSYLVYATVVDAAQAAVSGVVGLLSCVSCTWPVLGSVLTGVFGAGSALAGVATAYSYDISTAVFLVTVALLAWRPTLGGRDPDDGETPV